MATEVGQAYITILPSARGFGAALQREVGTSAATAGRTAGRDTGRAFGRQFGSSMRSIAGPALGTLATIGVARVLQESVTLEAEFSKAMNKIAASTGAPRREMRSLADLAIRMGGDTVFSAGDAADAMLSLAKGGLRPAEIRAGALADTLTLAAAGDLDLADAADTTVQAMGAFNISGGKTERIASALAGAANASAADVSDLTQSLAQAGTEAHSAGLSVEETTAFLAAFSNAGFQGSDAGTSLRTMLSRLSPQTEKAKAEMDNLGLSFVDAEGNFVSATEIAERMQTTFSDMSQSERNAALQTIFGSDSRRAANVLIDEGAEGIRKLIQKTSDLDAAQEMADAATRGTAGSLERLSGATETAQLKIGRGLAPTVRKGADRLAEFLDRAPLQRWARTFGRGVENVVEEVGPLGEDLLALGQEAWPTFVESAKLGRDVLTELLPLVRGIVKAFNSLPDELQRALILGYAVNRLGRRSTLVGGMLGGVGGGAAAGTAAGATAAGTTAAGAAAAGVAGAGTAARSTGRLATNMGRVRGTASRIGRAGGLAAIIMLPELVDTISGAESDVGDLDRAIGDLGRGKRGRVDILGNLRDFKNLPDLVSEGVRQTTGWRGVVFGLSNDVTGLSTQLQGVDERFAQMVRATPRKGLRSFEQLAYKAGVSVKDLKALLPDTADALEDTGAGAKKAADQTRAANRAGRNLTDLLLDNMIPAAGDLADKYNLSAREGRQLAGVLRDATRGGRGHERQLRQVADQLGLTREETRQLIAKYGDVPKNVDTDARFHRGGAERDVNAFVRSFNVALGNIDDEKVGVDLTARAQSAIGAVAGVFSGGTTLAVPGGAGGGEVRGPIKGRDSVLARLMPGEHIFTTDDVTKAGGQSMMYAIRRMIQNGTFARRGDVPRFRTGGAVETSLLLRERNRDDALATVGGAFARLTDAISNRLSDRINEQMRYGGGRPLGPGGELSAGQIVRGQQFARAQHGKPYIWGGVGPVGYDCSGFQSAIINASLGRNPYVRLGSTSTMPWAGFNAGPGKYTIGWFTGSPGHTSGNLGGLGVESTGDHVRVGGDARSPLDAMFNNVAHYDNAPKLRPGWTAAYNGTGRDEYVMQASPHQQRARRGPLRIELDVGGGRVLTGIMRDEINGHRAFDATTGRMRHR